MIVNRFEEQVKIYSERIAIKTVDRELSYQLLNSYANGIANEIISKCTESSECKKKDTVALLFEHGTDMIVSTIGALKSDKIYVPFDPSYPIKRLLYMLENSEASLIVTNNKNLELALSLVNETKAEISIFNIDEVDYASSIENIDRKVCKDDIAYILYTSGSTGKPKGVMQTHKNIAHFIKCYTNTLGITKEDRITLFSAFSHDAAIMDIYGALLNGATLYPLNIKEQISIDDLARWLQTEEITIYHSVPTVYRYFVNVLTKKEEFKSLRFIVLGGENVIEHDIAMFKKLFTSTRLVNLYGQTESSYNSSQIFLTNSEFEDITLGETVEKTEILVVDENREEVTPLSVGEIVIMSDYLALGYWKDEEKTKEVFKCSSEADKLYWTGDLGRLLEDGSIKFVGRKGSQVKIRGYRVELGEVETQLLNHEAIKQAVVLGRKDANGCDYLSAYIVSNRPLTVAELREDLSMQLPEYMIPSNFVELKKIPLTPNRKVDTKALLEVEGSILVGMEYEAPRNKVEEKLVKIWSGILKIDKVGINDDFFSLGGHSLKATSLVSKVHKEFDVEIPLIEIFKSPTIKEIAAYIGKAEKDIYVAIEPVEKREYYPVSSAQKRMYFLTEFEGNGINYNMPNVLEITGVIDKGRLETAFRELINIQESLRTYFEVLNGEIVQKIQEDVCFDMEYMESTRASESKVKEIINDFTKPFDLNKAPLFRVTLLKLSSNKYILMYDMHHIVSDGTSRQILVNQLIKLYDGDELPNVAIQYKDYAVWQEKFLKDNLKKQNEEYLLGEFKGELPVLNFPTDYSRPAIKQYDGDIYNISLDEVLTKKLKDFAIKNNVTLFMVILEAVSIVLSKYSGQEDIIIGTVTAGRTHADIENIIGLFLNNLAFRCKPIKELNVVEYLNILRNKVLKGYECQNYPIDEFMSKLNIKNDMSRGRLFDVMVILQNFDRHTKDIRTSKLDIKPCPYGNKRSEYDMTFYVYEQSDKLNISLEYSTRLFNRETIESMLAHFVNIANDMIDNSTKTLSQLNLLSETERNNIVYGFNSGKVEWPDNKMLHELFEEQVVKTPDNIAIVYENEKITYKDLNEKSNQIARLLRSKGVGKNQIVAILADRSFEMLIGILAILKSGAAYLPIDPIYPQERINFMIEDSKTKVVLVKNSSKNRIELDALVINLDYKKNYTGSNLNLDDYSTSKDLAYIIYTSGTTGKPKGILTKHSNVVSYVFAFNKLFNINSNDITLQQSSFTFDGLVEEVYTVLFKGGKVIVPNKDAIKDAKKLSEIINENKITILSCSPLILNEFNNLPYMKSIHTYLSSSDVLRKEYYSKLINYANVYNMYGPSEATVCTTYYKCDFNDSDNVPIGKPLGNNKVYIFDANFSMVPIGVTGEIYIGGDGLANGYLNNNDLTLEKFISNPLNNNEILYKTGDIGKWLPNGEIEFLGRLDFQIKVRGYRIELGEIESYLLKHNNIKETAIIVRENAEKNKYFCVYYVADAELNSLHLKEYLLKYLPEYMIPSFFIQLDKIPLNPNGKVDRDSLPEPTKNILLETDYVKPRNEIEKKIVSIWHEILEIDKEKIGIKHNFFDLGGNSINILKITNEINKEFNVNISIGEVLLNQTVMELANSIHKETIFSNMEYIVKINKSRSKKNVFIIHGADGDVYYYKDLAKLLENECNVYGIQSSGIKKESDLTVPNKDMLKYYLNEIKMIQKDGPYIIVGYCVGCIIAYDLIIMLEDYNDIVKKCIMIDEPAFIHKKIASIVNIKEQIIKPFDIIKNAIFEKKNIYLDNEDDIFSGKKDITLSESKDYVPDKKKIKEYNYKFVGKIYIPKRLIRTPIYVIKAEQSDLTNFTLKDWEKNVNSKVVLTEIAGNHETILQYPYVTELSNVFKEILND